MFTRKFIVLAAAALLLSGFSPSPAHAMHGGDGPCPMKHEMHQGKCCKGEKGKCPMHKAKASRSQALDRTAGAVPVYGKKDCGKKTAEMPCCKDKKGKCPMKHKGMDHGKGHEGHSPAATGHAAHGGHVSADMTYGGPEAKALDAAMAKMHRDMAVPATGDADADFIRGMIPHHQGAIDMARIVLEHGDDPDAQKLARNIIRAQKGEIAWMKRWLERRQLPATAPIDLRK